MTSDQKRTWLPEIRDLYVKQGLNGSEIVRRLSSRKNAPCDSAIRRWIKTERLEEEREAYLRGPRALADLYDRAIEKAAEKWENGKIDEGQLGDATVKLQNAKDRLYKPLHRRQIAFEVIEAVVEVAARKSRELHDQILVLLPDLKDEINTRFAEGK